MTSRAPLPSATIVIEWENALDVEDRWATRAIAALARELEATGPLLPEKPVVSYLFNSRQVSPAMIGDTIAQAAPTLASHARLDLVPVEGLTYYELKNHGARRARTEVTVFLDSDAAPESGWLREMLSPFAEPAVQAVGGITVLAHEDFLSRTLALAWIFGLREERHATAASWGIYANNTAVRTEFFRTRPFPRLGAYKYSCVFWLRAVLADGHRYVRQANALTVHAPHPNLRYVLWRGWVTGRDRDFYVFQARTPRRAGRLFRAATFFVGRTVRAGWRIATRRGSVGLPAWQVPGAFAVAFGYNASVLAGQLWSAAIRRHDALPEQRPQLTPLSTAG